MNTIEALESSDCMCLGLVVERPEAAVADATKLIIKDILPRFMTADTFLDSSIYKMKKNANAHGGFGKGTNPDLAPGVGNEKISGVMPLYLFREHWEIARKKAPPIYGFMCTLDIMGYAPSQYFNIPYMVLHKAIQKSKEENKSIYRFIEDQVLETCKQILTYNETHRNDVIKTLKNFHDSPEFRTIDIVPSIPVLITQLYVLSKIENCDKLFEQAGDFKLGQNEKQVIFRYILEEQLRRSLRISDPPLKNQILKTLFPDYKKFVNDRMVEIEQGIKKKFSYSSSDNRMDAFESSANMFRFLYSNGNQFKPTTNGDEESKEANHQSESISNINKFVEEVAATVPWKTSLLENGNSDCKKLVGGALEHFNKRGWIFAFANMLQISDKEIKSGEEFPLINGNMIVMFAIVFQNIMHPKNFHRREAVTAKTYVEITNQEVATQYINSMLTKNLKLEFYGKESAMRTEARDAVSYQSNSLFVEAPDVYYAAAILVSTRKMESDQYDIISQLCDGEGMIPSVKEKLKLLQMSTYANVKLYKNYFKDYPENFNFKKHSVFRLWYNLVRRKQLLTNDEFIEAIPESQKRAELWIQVVDDEGKQTRNLKILGKYIYYKRQAKRLK